MAVWRPFTLLLLWIPGEGSWCLEGTGEGPEAKQGCRRGDLLFPRGCGSWEGWGTVYFLIVFWAQRGFGVLFWVTGSRKQAGAELG